MTYLLGMTIDYTGMAAMTVENISHHVLDYIFGRVWLRIHSIYQVLALEVSCKINGTAFISI
jgi:hypothetical protein